MVAEVDRELFRLARGAGRLRLRVGEALDRLGDGFRELGFSSLGAYARERCSRSGRWAAESRVLARRLAALPELRAAVERGDVGFCMAELVARHATGESDGALTLLARRLTVRQMRELLRDASVERKGSAEENSTGEASTDADATPMRSIELRLSWEEAWGLEATRMLIEHMTGCSGSGFVEWLLAEGQTSLYEVLPEGSDVAPAHVMAAQARWLARMEEGRRRAEEEEARTEGAVESRREAGQAPTEDELPEGLHGVDRRVRQWCAELASRDLWLGRMAERFFAMGGVRALGYASEAQYARERLGMSRASVRAKVALARKARGLERIERAVQDGELGVAAAGLLVGVSGRRTEAAWVERARRRTFKHLREEVRATELMARATGRAVVELGPPSEADLSAVRALERDVLSGACFRTADGDACDAGNGGTGEGGVGNGVQMSASCAAAREGRVQMSALGSGLGETGLGETASARGATTMRLRLREDVALHFRQLEAAWQPSGSGGSFVDFLCRSFWQTWEGSLGRSDRWEHIYRRDLYRCTSPVCDSRQVTLHHIEYRAQGGGDEPENLTSPCPFCHLEGEHGGRLRILGREDWVIGREPIMRVRGRERVMLS